MQEEILNQIYDQVYESCEEILRMILKLDPDFDKTRAEKFFKNQSTFDELLRFEKEMLDDLSLRTECAIFDREVLERQNKLLRDVIKKNND